MINFNNPTFESVSNKEWLVTNGLGGYASSTISGANTRRYHGLFVPSLKPPTDRHVFVSKIEETVILSEGIKVNLSSNQYPDIVHPDGFQWITSFERKPLPRITFEGKAFSLSKIIMMPYLENTTIVQYQNLGTTVIQLELNPLYVSKDYHSLFHEDQQYEFFKQVVEKNVSAIYPKRNATPFYVHCPDSTFDARPDWYRKFIYTKEKERGLDDQGDAFSTGLYTLSLLPKQKAYMVFSMEKEHLHANWDMAISQEISRLQKLVKGQKSVFPIVLKNQDQQFYEDLIVAGDQFLVKRTSNDGHTIIAGYHWFTDWGRDTMIAMRGLVIAREHQELAKDIVRTFLAYLQDGLIPNRFPDQGETPEYNTIDASLWMFVVLHEYLQKFNDLDFIRECLPALDQILIAYKSGTRFKIHMTSEVLIYGGEGLSQLTWMDAKVGDYVVTPRHGCPIEINALWYNALCIYSSFLNNIQRDAKEWEVLSQKCKTNFRKYFLSSEGYLFDVVVPEQFSDDSFRINQIFTISLPFPLVTPVESSFLLEAIKKKLWTPLGMRSLARDNPDFIGTYGGDQWHRDKAYHQGTVWSYLIGEYWLAYLKVNNNSAKARMVVIEQMQGLKEHFYSSDCIHGISEIFDGENPGPGRGCIHQAWSVGMLLSVFDTLKK